MTEYHYNTEPEYDDVVNYNPLHTERKPVDRFEHRLATAIIAILICLILVFTSVFL